MEWMGLDDGCQDAVKVKDNNPKTIAVYISKHLGEEDESII